MDERTLLWIEIATFLFVILAVLLT